MNLEERVKYRPRFMAFADKRELNPHQKPPCKFGTRGAAPALLAKDAKFAGGTVSKRKLLI